MLGGGYGEGVEVTCTILGFFLWNTFVVLGGLCYTTEFRGLLGPLGCKLFSN